MTDISSLTSIGLTILSIVIVILVFYIIYLFFTKAFIYMGFTTTEALAIVLLSFLLGSGLVDQYLPINFSNIYLFSSGNWRVGINTGGAIIPIILSIYLIVKNKLKPYKVIIGIIIVSVVTYFVSYPNPSKGIVSGFPEFLLPAIFASLISIILLWKKFKKAAPLAYISGTIGVLIGADVFHLIALLNYNIDKVTPAVIGGAVVFDMVFITGILAVILDGSIMFNQRRKEGIE
jgi:uncharacterized membrane protein